MDQDARYRAFLETIGHLRPSLHRYCARMTGSVLDGEDVVQEALFQAYRKLDTFDDSRPLGPWLFRIAHNRCIDFLRRRDTQREADAEAVEPDFVEPIDPVGPALGRAVEHLVLMLPPKERACVLLKDVFDYSLEEVAELVDSTVGGVKAALNRGRTKLAATPVDVTPRRTAAFASRELVQLYMDRFNQRDWDGLRELIAADARLQVIDRFTGRMADTPYFANYERMRVPWRLVAGAIDSEPVMVVLRLSGGEWTPETVARIEAADGRVMRVVDYVHCPWIVLAATSIVFPQQPPVSH